MPNKWVGQGCSVRKQSCRAEIKCLYAVRGNCRKQIKQHWHRLNSMVPFPRTGPDRRAQPHFRVGPQWPCITVKPQSHTRSPPRAELPGSTSMQKVVRPAGSCTIVSRKFLPAISQMSHDDRDSPGAARPTCLGNHA